MKYSNENLVNHIFRCLLKIYDLKGVNDSHISIRIDDTSQKVFLYITGEYNIDYYNIDKLIKDKLKKLNFEQFPYELEYQHSLFGKWSFLNKKYLDSHILPATRDEMTEIVESISSFDGFIYNSPNGTTLSGNNIFIPRVEGYYLFSVTYQRYLTWHYNISEWIISYK